MRQKLFALTLALITALSFSSCIQSESVVTVKTDGSGTIENKTTMGGALMQMMQGFGQQLGAEPGSVPENPLAPDEEKLKAAAADFGEGVTFVGVEEVKGADGSVGVVAKYAFEDINKVSLNPEDAFGAMKDVGEMGQQMSGQGGAPPAADDEKKNEHPITFNFSAGSPATLAINFPQPDSDSTKPKGDDSPSSPSEAPDPTQMAMAQQMLGDMRFGLTLQVDGEVESSDASYQEGNATTLFSIQMGKMLGDPANLGKMQALENEEDFNKVKESLKDIDGMQFETKETVTIKFK
jgi:hypothetical protein